MEEYWESPSLEPADLLLVTGFDVAQTLARAAVGS
jgi:hypothetical protein